MMIRSRLRSRLKSPIGNFIGGASLDLNMLLGELDPRITFTRATGATRINASGLIEAVASNVPRFNYDPVTLAARGLLIEEQQTNLLLNSASLSTQTVTVSAVAYTISFYGAGVITFSGAATAVITGTGAYPSRTTYTFTPTAGALVVTVTGLAVNAQLELGASVTSYIPTTSAAATRAADVATMTGANFSSWYRQDEGTLFAEISDAAPLSSGASRRIANITDGTENNRITIGYAGGGGVAAAFVTSGGIAQAVFNSPSGAYPFPTKVAIAYKENDFCAAVNGSAFSTDTGGTLPIVDRMNIGDLIAGGTGPQNINGHIRRIAYFPRRLANAELRALTS